MEENPRDRTASEIKQDEADKNAGISKDPKVPLDYVPPTPPDAEDSGSDNKQVAGVGGNAPESSVSADDLGGNQTPDPKDPL